MTSDFQTVTTEDEFTAASAELVRLQNLHPHAATPAEGEAIATRAVRLAVAMDTYCRQNAADRVAWGRNRN